MLSPLKGLLPDFADNSSADILMSGTCQFWRGNLDSLTAEYLVSHGDLKKDAPRQVKVSVVVLTKNGGKLLAECINRVLCQKCDFAHELILMDARSTDGITDTCLSPKIRVRVINPEEFDYGLTRDLGYRISRGEIVANLSQDALPADEYWLANLIRPFEDANVAAVQGSIDAPPEGESFYWEQIGMFNFTRETKKWIMEHQWIGLSNTNSAVRKGVWEHLQYGRAPVSEDKVLQSKLTNAGFHIARAMDARVYSGHKYNLSSLSRQCFNEGLGWKCAGQNYCISDLAHDLVNPNAYRALMRGVASGRARSLPELAFPIIRPAMLYVGNRIASKYVR